MSDATDFLAHLFGLKPDAPAPAVPPDPAPAVTTASPGQPQCDGVDLDGVDLDGAQPDAPDFGPDGWPVGCIDPQPCPTCPGLLTWQDAGGRWRCEACDADAMTRAQRLADAAARARQQPQAATATVPVEPRRRRARPVRLVKPAPIQGWPGNVKPGCNHTLHLDSPGNTWTERQNGGRVVVECKHCGRFYGCKR